MQIKIKMVSVVNEKAVEEYKLITVNVYKVAFSVQNWREGYIHKERENSQRSEVCVQRKKQHQETHWLS